MVQGRDRATDKGGSIHLSSPINYNLGQPASLLISRLMQTERGGKVVTGSGQKGWGGNEEMGSVPLDGRMSWVYHLLVASGEVVLVEIRLTGFLGWAWPVPKRDGGGGNWVISNDVIIPIKPTNLVTERLSSKSCKQFKSPSIQTTLSSSSGLENWSGNQQPLARSTRSFW